MPKCVHVRRALTPWLSTSSGTLIMSDDEAGRIRHQETLDGHWFCDEQEGDDAKLLGVYSTQGKADARIEQARLQPGFSDEPDCFLVAPFEVDKDEWTAGYDTT